MRAVRLTTALALALAVVLAAPASTAYHSCAGNGTVLRVGAAGVNAAYVALDMLDFGGHYGNVWIYEESNGIPDLQRGGVSTLFGDADVCQDHPTPDLLHF